MWNLERPPARVMNRFNHVSKKFWVPDTSSVLLVQPYNFTIWVISLIGEDLNNNWILRGVSLSSSACMILWYSFSLSPILDHIFSFLCDCSLHASGTGGICCRGTLITILLLIYFIITPIQSFICLLCCSMTNYVACSSLFSWSALSLQSNLMECREGW